MSLPATPVPDLRIGKLLSQAWYVLKSRFWFAVGVFIVCYLVFPAVDGVYDGWVQGMTRHGQETLLATPMVKYPFKLATTLVNVMLGAGGIYVFMRLWLGQEVVFGDVFKGFAKFWRVLGFQVLVSLGALVALFVVAFVFLLVSRLAGHGLGAVVALALCLPLLYLGTAFMPGLVVVMETELGPLQALKGSWQLTRGYRWRLLFVALATAVLAVLGLVALGVGILVTAPLGSLMLLGAYDELARAYVARMEATVAAAPA